MKISTWTGLFVGCLLCGCVVQPATQQPAPPPRGEGEPGEEGDEPRGDLERVGAVLCQGSEDIEVVGKLIETNEDAVVER